MHASIILESVQITAITFIVDKPYTYTEDVHIALCVIKRQFFIPQIIN